MELFLAFTVILVALIFTYTNGFHADGCSTTPHPTCC